VQNAIIDELVGIEVGRVLNAAEHSASSQRAAYCNGVEIFFRSNHCV